MRNQKPEYRNQHIFRKIRLNKIFIWLLVTGYWLLAKHCFAEGKFFEIKAKKFAYTPHIIRVNKGDTVKIRLVSEDVTHGLFIDGYGVNTSAHPGQEGSLSFVANRTGRFSFRCSVTCGEFHPYMIGYLVVEPNLRFLVYIVVTIFFGLCSILFIALRRNAEKQ